MRTFLTVAIGAVPAASPTPLVATLRARGFVHGLMGCR